MANSKTVAVIDIGSNSVVMLVARCGRGGDVEPVNELFAITRLGKEVSKSGNLSEDAVEKTISAASEMKIAAEAEGADDIIIVATHAIREANNRSEFLVRCHRDLDVFPQVLSGKEEAKFTYLGATSDMPKDSPILSIDIGGGSTEIAFGTKDIMIEAYSLPFGCVSVCEQFGIGKNDWITNRIAAKNFVRRNLFTVVDPVNTWLKSRKPLVVATGGTATTYAAILIGKKLYDRDHIHMKKSFRKEVAVTARTLSRMGLEERIKVPGMEKDRAEVLPAGLLILSEILEFFVLDQFTISVNGLRAGILRNYILKHF